LRLMGVLYSAGAAGDREASNDISPAAVAATAPCPAGSAAAPCPAGSACVATLTLSPVHAVAPQAPADPRKAPEHLCCSRLCIAPVKCAYRHGRGELRNQRYFSYKPSSPYALRRGLHKASHAPCKCMFLTVAFCFSRFSIIGKFKIFVWLIRAWERPASSVDVLARSLARPHKLHNPVAGDHFKWLSAVA
jgi:hypothetical protein